MNWLFNVVIAIALAWAGAQNAHAGRGVDLARGQALWDAAVKGRSTTIGTGNGMLKIGSPMGTTSAGAAGAAKVSGSGTVPVADKQVPNVGFTGEVAKEAIVGGVVGCATGGIVGCALGVGTPLAIAWLGMSGARINPSTGLPEQQNAKYCPSGACTRYRLEDKFYYTADEACSAWASASTARDGYVRFFSDGGRDDGACLASAFYRDTGGVYYSQAWRAVGIVKTTVPISTTEPEWTGVSPQELKDKLYRNPDPRIVDELSKAGNITWPLGNVKVTGPAEVKGPKLTTVSQSGNRTDTTVSQQNTPLSYSGDTITAGNTTRTSTTTTTTTNPDGTTSTSTSTTTETTEQGTEGEAPPKEEPAPTDTALPPVPELYTRKYPQGMEGIYEQYKDQLKNTSLVQLSKQLMPNVGDGGTCPSWPINLNWDWWIMYGVHDVAPPCWIWDVAKAILILSALLLARALIFGG